MTRSMVKMSGKGDEVVAEYDVETATPERLAEIEKEFNEMLAKGYFAADITDKKNEEIRSFDPNADILMIPAVQGG